MSTPQPLTTPSSDRFPFVTPFHIFFWLLSRPAGWRKILNQIDPSLRVDFSIASLTSHQLKNPRLWRFLAQNYLMLCIASTGIVGLALFLLEVPSSVIFQSTVLALGYSLLAPVVWGYTFGVGSSFVFGGTLAIGIGLLARQTEYYPIPVALASGLAGCVLLNRVRQVRTGSSGRIVIGIFIGILAAFLLLQLGVIIISGEAFGLTLGAPGALPLPQSFAATIAIPTGALTVILFTLAIAFRNKKSIWRALPIGGVLGLLIGLNYFIFSTNQENSPLYLLAAAIGASLFMCLLFTLSWVLTDWIGGSLAASVAGALVNGLSWVLLSRYLVAGYTFKVDHYYFALGAIAVGLSFSIWYPLLFLPLFSIWNNFLYALDRRETSGPLKFFHLHSTFWEELQLARWPGLDDYLLLQAERDPAGFEKTAVILANTPQRGAVQAVEILLLGKLFESCEDASAISQVYRKINTRLLEIPVATIIRTFIQLSRDTEAAINQSSLYQTKLAMGRVRDELIAFQRDLIISTHSYTDRFLEAASKWGYIIEDHIQGVANQTALLNEIENPYICGIPLNSQQEVFVGRTDIMARIEHLLLDPHHHSLHLYGQRRMGKTSLLLNLDHYLPSSIISVFLDGQGLAGYQASGELMSKIVEEIRSEFFRQRGLRLPPMMGDDLTTSNYGKIMAWVDDVEKTLSNQKLTVLILMDEFEALIPILEAPASKADEFLGMARFIAQHRPHFKSIFVGSHTLDEIGKWSAFLINSQVIKIGRLEHEETLRLIESPVKNFILKFEPAASQRILDLTSGHPHLVQSICYELVTYKNEQPGDQRFIVTLPDVEEAARRSLSSISFFFADIRGNQVNSDTARMLDYLADLGELGKISHQEWSEKFPEHFGENLALAIKRDLVEKVDGTYHFQVEMIRRWFENRPF